MLLSAADCILSFFFFNDTATTEIYTLSLHDALPISLSELGIVGLPTSQPFHLRVMDDAEFLKGEIDIKYLGRAGSRVLAAPPRQGLERALAVAAAMVADEQRGRTVGPSDGRTAPGLSPWVVESRRLGLRDDLE